MRKAGRGHKDDKGHRRKVPLLDGGVGGGGHHGGSTEPRVPVRGAPHKAGVHSDRRPTGSVDGSSLASPGRQAAKLTVGELAAVLGVSREIVYRWRKRPDWPFGRGPYDLAAVREWRTMLQEDRSAVDDDDAAVPVDGKHPLIAATGNPVTDQILRTMSPMMQGKMRAIMERGQKLALENALTQRGLVERAEVERGWVERVTVVRASLLALPRQLAGDLEHKGRAEVERVLQEAMERVCRQFSGE